MDEMLRHLFHTRPVTSDLASQSKFRDHGRGSDRWEAPRVPNL